MQFKKSTMNNIFTKCKFEFKKKIPFCLNFHRLTVNFKFLTSFQQPKQSFCFPAIQKCLDIESVYQYLSHKIIFFNRN